MNLRFHYFLPLTIFFYVVVPVVIASDPVALVDASLLPTRFLLVVADVTTFFTSFSSSCWLFFDFVFADFFDFALAISLLSFNLHYFIRSYDGMYLIVYLYLNYR